MLPSARGHRKKVARSAPEGYLDCVPKDPLLRGLLAAYDKLTATMTAAEIAAVAGVHEKSLLRAMGRLRRGDGGVSLAMVRGVASAAGQELVLKKRGSE